MRFVEINNLQDLDLVRLSPAPIALDTETTGLDPRKDTLLRIVIAQDGVAYSMTQEVGRFILNGHQHDLILQNFKFDLNVLYRNGVQLYHRRVHDIMLMHHLIDENAKHSLEEQVQYSFQDNYKEEFWRKYGGYEKAPREAQLEYECKDAIYTEKLFYIYQKILHEKRQLVQQVHELALALAITERDGVRVDTEEMMKQSLIIGTQVAELGASLRPSVEDYCQRWEMEKWYEEIAKLKTDKGKAGVPRPVFNFSSGSQIQWLLFSDQALGMPVLSKTKAGKPSTDFDALCALSEKHEIVRKLRDFKQLETLYNTFIVGLLERQQDGTIYPEFNVNGTHTGRISSSNPNLQNMPKEGPYRGFFIPSEGMCFFGADYSQLEVVIEANLSGDKNLRRMLLEGSSKHDITNDELKLGDRNLAKTLNFAMQYWCSPFKVKELLNVSQKDAEDIYNRYWQVYAGVRQLKSFTDKRVDNGLPIVSPFGRERHLPQSFEKRGDENRAKRQAYNALIQGTGADITNLAFGRFASRMRDFSTGRMLWQIHDELLGECDPAHVDMHKALLVEEMELISDELQWDLPLRAVPYGALTKWAKT